MADSVVTTTHISFHIHKILSIHIVLSIYVNDKMYIEGALMSKLRNIALI